MDDFSFLDSNDRLFVPLYKYYGDTDHAKDAIINKRIHFESPEEYNDIFDCSTYVTDEQLGEIVCDGNQLLDIIGIALGKREDLDIFERVVRPAFVGKEKLVVKEVLTLLFDSLPDLQKKGVLDILRAIFGVGDIIIPKTSKRVSCFTENKDSILMWSYYANSHKGVCLEFDLKGDTRLNRHCHKVRYSRHFDVGDEAYTYFTKSDQWSHEQEWRIVGHDKEYELTDCLKAIYLGYRIDNDKALEFFKLGEKYGLDVYIVKPSTNEYSLKFIRIFEKGKLSVTSE